ncbi:MAG TPA: hypothetical protein VKT78_15220 [Fimbriimonadaceae bacterium]|nr:hypothetical protein [Fimbriimonadaceae bacterium]
MNRLGILVLALVALALNGCGGSGGGGGTATVTGRVIYVETGGAPNPVATVQVGSVAISTDASDGSFTLQNVPTGITTLTVNTNSASGVWTFTIAPATASTTEDVGDLWVGPQRVTLAGAVLDSSTNNPISGATVKFGGAIGKTNASGLFSLSPVAYPNTNFAAFWGIVGNVTANNYFANTFSASPNTSVNGTVTVASILLTPLSNTSPPPPPYNIWGRITPTAEGVNCTVTLLQNGTPVRRTLADATGTYYFWVAPGTYTLHFVSGTHTDPSDPTVTVKSTNDVERQDVVLN